MQSTQGLEPTIRPPRRLAELTFALVVVLVAVAVAAALAATPAFAAYPGQNGKFVWEKGPCPNCGLVLVDRNGSTRITPRARSASPARRSFAMISSPSSPRRRVGGLSALGARARLPPRRRLRALRHPCRRHGAADARRSHSAMSDQTRPTWSSDGTEIAYANPATGEVTIVDASGPPNPRIIPITAGGTDLTMAYVVWSPRRRPRRASTARGRPRASACCRWTQTPV